MPFHSTYTLLWYLESPPLIDGQAGVGDKQHHAPSVHILVFASCDAYVLCLTRTVSSVHIPARIPAVKVLAKCSKLSLTGGLSAVKVSQKRIQHWVTQTGLKDEYKARYTPLLCLC